MIGSRLEDTHCDMFAGCTVRADSGGKKPSSAPRQMRSVWSPSSTTTVDVASNGDVKGTLRQRSTSTWPARTVHVSGNTRRLKQGRGRYSRTVSITASTSDMPIPLITLTGSASVRDEDSSNTSSVAFFVRDTVGRRVLSRVSALVDVAVLANNAAGSDTVRVETVGVTLGGTDRFS